MGTGSTSKMGVEGVTSLVTGAQGRLCLLLSKGSWDTTVGPAISLPPLPPKTPKANHAKRGAETPPKSLLQASAPGKGQLCPHNSPISRRTGRTLDLH